MSKALKILNSMRELELKNGLSTLGTDEAIAELKAKDEEIKELKDQLSTTHNIMYLNGYSDAIDCYDTFGKFNIRSKPNAKARSIVAMLFWQQKKAKANYGVSAQRGMKNSFKIAHVMLKDNYEA